MFDEDNHHRNGRDGQSAIINCRSVLLFAPFLSCHRSHQRARQFYLPMPLSFDSAKWSDFTPLFFSRSRTPDSSPRWRALYRLHCCISDVFRCADGAIPRISRYIIVIATTSSRTDPRASLPAVCGLKNTFPHHFLLQTTNTTRSSYFCLVYGGVEKCHPMYYIHRLVSWLPLLHPAHLKINIESKYGFYLRLLRYSRASSAIC